MRPQGHVLVKPPTSLNDAKEKTYVMATDSNLTQHAWCYSQGSMDTLHQSMPSEHTTMRTDASKHQLSECRRLLDVHGMVITTDR